MRKRKKTIIVVTFVFAMLALVISNEYLSFIPKKIVVGETLPKEVQKMNRAYCGEGPHFYKLDYAKEDLMVAHNHLYMVVLQKQDGEWLTACLVNPYPIRRFRLQGSTVTSVKVDNSARYIAIVSTGTDGIDSPLYIFDLERTELQKYAHDDYPADMTFSEQENMVRGMDMNMIPPPEIGQYSYDTYSHVVTFYDENNDIKKEIKLIPEPNTDIYMLDENTLVYMFTSDMTMGSGNILGAYRICFLNVDTGKSQEVMIQ